MIWQIPDVEEALAMELNELLGVMDRAAANLGKLEQIWARAAPMVPDGPVYVTTMTEYEDLARDWRDLLVGLPPINGWRITVELPDPAAIGQAYIEYLDIGEPPISVYEERVVPERELAEYRHRLGKARRQAVRTRLEELTAQVDLTLPVIVAGVRARFDRGVEERPGHARSRGRHGDRATHGRLGSAHRSLG